MSDSDFEEIQPVGLPRKRYPSRKPHAIMGELVSSDTSDFEEDPEERQRTERVATAAEEMALKLHFGHKLGNNQV